MNCDTMSRDVAAFQSALGAAPEVAQQLGRHSGNGSALGIVGWQTTALDRFELPATDGLVIALHLGGARQVRAVTERGLSRSCSTPGLITVLPPGRATRFRTAGRLRVATLHVPKATFGDLAPSGSTPMPGFALRDDYVGAGISALLNAAHETRGVNAGYVEKVTDALLCHLAQTLAYHAGAARGPVRAGVTIGRAPLADVLDHIARHLGRKLLLEELCGLARISRASFNSAFKAVTGSSPHQYIVQSRIEAAKTLLSDSEFDLAFIAQEVGFCSQSHFTETFRVLTGVTPREYRRRR